MNDVRATRYALALSVLVGSLLSSCALFPCVERTHASGLRIVCYARVAEMPETLRSAWSSGRTLAEAYPDAFGYPWPDATTGELEVRLAGENADAILERWLAGTATQGTGEKTRLIPRPEVPLRRVATQRAVAQLIAIQHAVTPPKGMPDADLVNMAGPDEQRNAVVIGIDRVSDALLGALAARYGTEAIVILVVPGPRGGY